jgi:predicted dehydrogenase
MDQIRWGIIGCGDVTELKSGPAFNKVEGSELVAVMRRNKERAEDYARRHNVPKWYGNAQKLIFDPDVNAIYVATPTGSHAEYTLRAASAGKPVYVEKPMARNFVECERMIEECDKADVPLFVAYYRRYLPSFLKIKELIEAGAIGEVRCVTIALCNPPAALNPDNLPWRVVPEISGGGYFLDLAAHQFDFLDYILGPVKSARGLVANQAGLYRAEDIVCADFVFESGVLGSGIWCFTVAEYNRTDLTAVIGSKGKITYDTFAMGPVKLETEIGIEEFQFSPPKHIQLPLIQTIVKELQGSGKCPSTGITAARTSRTMDKIVGNF